MKPVLALLLTLAGLAGAEAWHKSLDRHGEAVLRKNVLGSPLVLRASQQFAGALYSLTWRGREFLNAFDHGRELQTAASFDGFGECYNPTEAGTQHDGSLPTSSSRLFSISYSKQSLQTTSDMAFWMLPGQTYPSQCGSRPDVREARNTTVLGNYRLSKRVTIGHGPLSNVLEYDVAMEVPRDHEEGTFELLTGYMPPDFSAFLAYDPAQGKLIPLSDGPGEQPYPVVLSTPDGRFAMAAYSPGVPAVGYGRFRFLSPSPKPGEDTVKWNVVFRQKPVKAGTVPRRIYVIVGSTQEIVAALSSLMDEAGAKGRR